MCLHTGSCKRKLSHVETCTLLQESREGVKSPAKKPRKWTVWEDIRLIVAARRYGISQWKHVANDVGNARNHMQVLQRWKAIIEPAFSQVKWSEAEDAFLRFETSESLKAGKSLTALSWRQLATRIPFRSGPELEARWFHCLADAKQKLDYSSKSSEASHDAGSIFGDKATSPPLSLTMPGDEFDNNKILSPPQPSPPPAALSPQTQVSEQAHKKKEVTVREQEEEEDLYLPFIDASDLITHLPLSAAEMTLYDDIKYLFDLPPVEEVATAVLLSAI